MSPKTSFRTHNTVPPVPPVPLYGTVIDRKMSAYRQREWLHRSLKWKELDSAIWNPRKILGIGGNGLVGLWDYTGSLPPSQMPRHMVVKQARHANAMRWESRFLKMLTATGSEHFVKLYKSVYRTGGTGTSNFADPIPFDRNAKYDPDLEISRFYLEYCANGDLHHYADRLSRRMNILHEYPPEEYLWRIFACLAKAVLVLETGSEDPEKPNAKFPYPIAHFDIKPMNVLIGDRDASEHKRLNIMKITDLGLAQPVPDDTTDPKWIKQTQWRATSGWMSPEQRYIKHPNRSIGHESNVWAAGAIMHNLLTGGKEVHQKPFAHLLYGRASGLCMVQGSTLLDPIPPSNNPLPYSRHLIDTVLHCLAFDPADRITAASLVITTQYLLSDFDTMPLKPHPDPLKARALANIQPPNKPRYPARIQREPLRNPGPGPPPNGFPLTQTYKPPGVDPMNPATLFPPEVPNRPRTTKAVRYQDYPFREVPRTP